MGGQSTVKAGENPTLWTVSQIAPALLCEKTTSGAHLTLFCFFNTGCPSPSNPHGRIRLSRKCIRDNGFYDMC